MHSTCREESTLGSKGRAAHSHSGVIWEGRSACFLKGVPMLYSWFSEVISG